MIEAILAKRIVTEALRPLATDARGQLKTCRKLYCCGACVTLAVKAISLVDGAPIIDYKKWSSVRRVCAEEYYQQ